MDDVMYSKLNMKKKSGCPPEMKTHLEGTSTILYAEIATSGSQTHLPAVHTTPETTEHPVRKSNYGIFFIVQVIIIIILCCALGYMVYKDQNQHQDVNDGSCRKEIENQLCVSPNKTQEGCILCPSNWLLYGDNCYYYTDATQRSWNQSQDLCEIMGAHLLVIEDQGQQTDDMFWIGLYHKGDGWRWVNSRHYNTSLFQLEVNSENCALMNEVGYHTGICNSTYRFICQREAVKI
ncbi:killer cell lectin-like receptor subfamily G member 1 isoform X2 [Mixophyes fleayi]|uniref:killer cell lectin-like receptor subfamily G member 1 isoform X2 n=1 Tax=Mixophyes fleayi TaxID=3061075 RepID=UPI003F4DD423